MIRNYSIFDTKFRAWIHAVDDVKEGVLSYNVYPMTNNELWFDGDIVDINDDCIVMQSIGATDKTCKEWFNLDVDSEGRVLVWNKVELGYYLAQPNRMKGLLIFHVSKRNLSELEIIGTIFDPKHKDLYDKVKEKLGL